MFNSLLSLVKDLPDRKNRINKHSCRSYDQRTNFVAL